MKLYPKLLTICWLCLLIGCEVSAHGNEEDFTAKEVVEIVKVAIDLPELQEYFHVETLPNRKPLIIKVPEEIESVSLKSIKKFGQSVKEYREIGNAPVYEITKFKASDHGVSFDAIYMVEGIKISYEFKKVEGRWVVSKSAIVER